MPSITAYNIFFIGCRFWQSFFLFADAFIQAFRNMYFYVNVIYKLPEFPGTLWHYFALPWQQKITQYSSFVLAAFKGSSTFSKRINVSQNQFLHCADLSTYLPIYLSIHLYIFCGAEGLLFLFILLYFKKERFLILNMSSVPFLPVSRYL